MARTQTMVQLNDQLVRLLDWEAGRRGISRSALIREILDEHLKASREAEIDRQIIEGYKRIPWGTPDEWGPTDNFGKTAAREMLRRLDAEERGAGLEPW